MANCDALDQYLHPIKIVVVGDGSVGKTSLLMSFTHNRFPVEYVPTVFDNHTCHITVDEFDIDMGLWDTAGQEDYDRLRPLSYPQTNLFLVCFSVALPQSYINISQRWVPEILHNCPGVPFFIVATKIDLRQDNLTRQKIDAGQMKDLISFQQGLKLAKKVKASGYHECSALTQENLRRVFEEVGRFFMYGQKRFSSLPSPRESHRKSCIIL